MNTKKNQIGNYIFIAGLFVILMLNLNTYEMYMKVSYYNYLIASAVITAVFICYTDIKTILKDKLFLCVGVINVITIINLLIVGTGIMSFFVVYSFTVGMYLTTKVLFDKKQMYILTGMIAFFFVYWTIDVKGYFKGYSINFGGLVLISGFIFLILATEYIKYVLFSSTSEKKTIKYIKKYPFYYTFFEVVLFVIAYNIISWYRSRTALMALAIFALLMCIPKKFLANIKVEISIFVFAVLGMIAFPYAYIRISDAGLFSDVEVFYKPLLGNRADIYKLLIELTKLHPTTGNGTIYVSGTEPFRDGLLDTVNGGLQLFSVYGIITGTFVLGFMGYVIIKLIKDSNGDKFATASFAGIITLIVASYSESCIFTAPFILIFSTSLYIMRSITHSEFDSVKNTSGTFKNCFSNVDFKEKAIPVFFVTVMVLYMYLILGPLEIFYSNYDEFKFNTSDFMVRFIPIFGVISVVATLVISSFPKICAKVYCVLALSIGVISYIQYMFINGDLVDDNGNFAVSSEIMGRQIASVAVTVIVFAIVILIAVKFSKYLRTVTTYVSLFITLIMFIATITIGVNLLMLEDKPYNKLVYDATDEYTYAESNNTIVIILDTFGKDALYNEYATNPESKDVFSDFTFYENEDSVYSSTFPSLIHFLTEYEYDETSKPEFQKEAFTSENSTYFYNELHEQGYNVSFNTADLLEEDYMTNVCDNMVTSKMIVNYKDITNKLFKMSVYRYVPYFLKGYYEVYLPTEGNVTYDKPQTCTANDTFFQRIKDWGIHKDSKYNKKFTLTHLHGIHTPYRNDAEGNPVEWGSVSRDEVTHGLMHIMNEYFNMLKEAGVYDEATIIVLADHGDAVTGSVTDPIFFKKDSYETHDEMVISDEGLTHCDLQRLIIESLK